VTSASNPEGKTKTGAAASQQRELPKLPENLEATVEKIVEFQWTIAAYNPELPAIFSTPGMISLMEVAAARAIQEHLPPGTISVGTRIEVDHLKAVPQGTTVQAHARLVGNQGRFLAFDVEARVKDKDIVIGRGKVYRAIVPLPSPNNALRP
jgi:fluoroacetyl-CoA thioesterase